MLGTLEEDLKKIEDMEDSAEFQIKLQALRKKMLEIKRWYYSKIPCSVFSDSYASSYRAGQYDPLLYFDW